MKQALQHNILTSAQNAPVPVLNSPRVTRFPRLDKFFYRRGF